MRASDFNFAGRVVRRLSANSMVADAATGEMIASHELRGLILGAAHEFLSRGLRPGDPIVISCGLSPASSLAYFGAMYAGLVVVPLDERSFKASGQSICLKTKAKGVWTALPGQCQWAMEAGVVHCSGAFANCFDSSLPPAPCQADDLAALMATSGSTGAPRLVNVSHGNLTANTEAIIRSQSLREDERAMLVMPLSYCLGASVIHTHLYQGGGIVFDSRFMFADKVLRAINTFSCTTFAGVPTVYQMLARRSSIRSIPMPSLRRFLQAGGGLVPACVQTIRQAVPTAQFFVMYGQTEATARITCLPADQLSDKIGSVGLPLENLALQIQDEQGRELPQGGVGEILVKGPSICHGYFDDADETERKFCDGWLKTGDLGSLDQDGFLWIKGRKSEFIKTRGVRVDFGEVEARVAGTEGVLECAAVSVPHVEAGEALALFVVTEHGADNIPARVRQALPPHWTCSSVQLISELPRTSNGKIARHLLREAL